MITFIVRVFFFLAMAATGYAFGQALGMGKDPTVAAVEGGKELWGMLGFMAAAIGVIVLDIVSRRKNISMIAAVFFGLIVGLVVATLLTPVVDMYTTIPERVRDVIKMGVAALTAYGAVSLILQTKNDFRFIIPYIEFSKQQKGGRPLLLDTSVIIDGRIADIAETRFIDSPIVVPRFILHELQAIADSADRMKRDRGRRGLDILNRLQGIAGIDVTIEDVGGPATPGDGADQMLVSLATKVSGRIVTIDYNLNKVAKVSGVEVLNVNDLANALKSTVMPGQILEVSVLRQGQEPAQGVAYLEDGTMVVVEDGGSQVGKTVTITVTNVIQKSAGRIIFGRIDMASKPRGR
jgi:uncharacterized protein YacL